MAKRSLLTFLEKVITFRNTVSYWFEAAGSKTFLGSDITSSGER